MTQAPFTVARALAFAREHGDDRIGVFQREDAVIVVVADGAGGLAGGARAAELLVELVGEAVASPALDPLRDSTWVDVLANADQVLEADPDAGETTAVVVALSEEFVLGASCGDSGAWFVHADATVEDLTAGQWRRLRVGSGRAWPLSFLSPTRTGTLLVGTDGLFNYARRESIAAVALGGDLEVAAGALVDLVRLPRGGLQDDVGVALVRHR